MESMLPSGSSSDSPGESSLPGLHMATFSCPLMEKREAADSVGGGLSCVSSYKDTNLTMREISCHGQFGLLSKVP